MQAMRHRTILFWTLMLVLLGGTSLYAQCSATAPPGQPISFPLTAHFSQGGPTAPDGGQWQVITKVDGVQQQQASMSANPSQGSPNTTISGTVPSWSGTFEIDSTYTWPTGSNTIQCFYTQSQPLQINGFCPATAVFAPGDPISVPFSASGGNTKQYVWSVSSPSPFTVSPSTGANTTVQGNAPAQSTSFTVTLAENPVAGFTSPAAPVSRTCQITVAAAPLQINGACPANSFLPNDPISIPFTASGGNTKQYLWNVTAPFSVSPTSGSITTVQGNAPQQTTSFTLTLSEGPPISTSSSVTPAAPVTKICQIVVAAPLGITGTCPAAAIAPGAPVSIPLAGSGGSGNYMWVINPTNIGLSLSSSTGSTTTVQG